MAYSPHFTAILDERRSTLRAQLDAYLPTHGEFVWEIGCGHGHFLAAYAAAHPQTVCIGIDIASDRVARAQRKRDRAKLTNLHFVHAEARLFLDTLPEGPQIGTIFLLFPDPWPKLRHNKHRLVQTSFLASAAAHAVAGCPLYFRTDHTPYFESARGLIADDPHWTIRDEPWPFEFATVFQQRAANFHSLVARCKLPQAPAKSASAVRNTL